MRVVCLPEADRDLFNIYAYICQYDERAAGDHINRIRKAILRLQDHPWSAPPRPDVGDTARGLSVDPYVTLYRVVGQTVEIVRIVHGARDARSFAVDFDGCP